MASTNEMTAESLKALKADLARLETVERLRIADEIKTARGFGDLSENAEYHAAKEAQAHLETRIAQLRGRVTDAVIVKDSTSSNVIGFGSVVALTDENTGKNLKYKLVAAIDADPAAGNLSVDSPVARALRGKRTGDLVLAAAPRGQRSLRINSIG